jgi:hypothetical protein
VKIFGKRNRTLLNPFMCQAQKFLVLTIHIDMLGLFLCFVNLLWFANADTCPGGRTLSIVDGKCNRDYPPSMVWTWIAGSTTDTTSAFNSSSFGASTGARAVWSKTKSSGYLLGGYIGSDRSPRIYSFNANFSSIALLSSCSTMNYGTLGVESASSCPPGRSPNAIWLVEDQYVYIFGGFMNSISCSSDCLL